MKKINTIRRVILAVVWVSMGVLLVQCQGGKERSSQTKKEQVTDQTRKVYPVKVMEVASQMVSKGIDYAANLSSWEEVFLAPAQPGRIEKIYVEVGDEVAVGAKIADMDPTQLLTAKMQLADAQVNMERLDTLVRAGGISQQQYDQVKMQYDMARTNVQFLERNTWLTAPISGVVTGKYYENQELFSGAPNTPSGKAAIVTLQQMDPVRAFVNVSENYFPLIREGMTAMVSCDIYPGHEVKGVVSRIHPVINAMTRTFMVEVRVPNGEKTLRSGMSARVRFELGKEETMVLPSVAILQQEGTNERYVFVNRNQTARRVSVTLGRRFDDQIEVYSDELRAGDQLVVAGQRNLLDGYRLKVVAQ